MLHFALPVLLSLCSMRYGYLVGRRIEREEAEYRLRAASMPAAPGYED